MGWRPGQVTLVPQTQLLLPLPSQPLGPARQRVSPGILAGESFPGWAGCGQAAPPAAVLKDCGCTASGTRESLGTGRGTRVPSSRSPVFITPARGLCPCSPCSRLELGSEPRTKPQPLPTQKLDPAQLCSCCQSPSSQPDTCSYSRGRPSLPAGLWAGREGTCGAEGTTSVSPARQGPQMGPPGTSPKPILFLFSHEWRLLSGLAGHLPPCLLLPSNLLGQNHTNIKDRGCGLY